MSRALIAVLAAVMAAPLAGCSSRTDTETFGNFRIETWRSEGFGHSGHSFKVFHLHGSRAHEVANRVAYFLDPNSPDRILVRGCLDMANEDTCALRYFDGVTDETHVISNQANMRNGSRLYWSPSGRFLAVVAQEGFLMVDLDSGGLFDVGAPLDLRLPERGLDMFEVAWSPDGALVGILISNSLMPPSDIEFDLLVVDAGGSSIRYVASRPWKPVTGEWFQWQQTGNGYDLVVSPDPSVFRKRRYQIPSGIGY